jgi:endoglucanase
MKHLLILVGFLYGFLPANAQQLSFKEIRTASDTVLVAFFKDAYWSGPVYSQVWATNQVMTSNLSQWTLNGQPVTAANRFVTEANAVDYHIYLQVPKLTNGMAYTLETPYGNTNFVFDDTQIFCESIKVNQNGYSALSQVRYANLAIWLGDGGAQPISGAFPTYTVFKQFTGEQVASGTLTQFGGGAQDASSGDYVYRIDLSGVPEGGPYKVSVSGFGCSYPFGVGGDFSRRLGYVAFRALYYQRCGVPIITPYAWANIRPTPCHTLVYDSQSPGVPNVVLHTSTDPQLTVHGGYHDAGDCDRMAYHMMVPMVLMTTYEVFPNLFTDDQFNIPDIFDANFHILGKGNGVPDIIDEAVWGTMLWTNLQSTSKEPAGAVAFGENAPGNGNPVWGINWDQDTLQYGTETNTVESCGLAAGLFMNLARLVKPYDAVTSASLQARGDAAYSYAGVRGTIKTTHKLYYAIQKYLLTGDVTASNIINSLYTSASSFPSTYNNEAGGYLSDGNMWLASFFMSYIIETNRPTNPNIVNYFKACLKQAADNQVNWTTNDAYPVGWPANVTAASHNFNQGGLTPQGQFAYPCLMQWALTKEQKYIDTVSQLMDYDQGLNPLGKCYMTGIGFDGVHHPHTRESAYAQVTMGWGGPLAGITVYGPLEPAKLSSSPNSKQIPPLSGLPRERCFVDHLGFWAMDEFTVYQSEVFPAAIYAVLAQGGKWDSTKEPFAVPAMFKTTAQTDANTLTFTWSAEGGQTYQMQYSTDLTQTNWTNLGSSLTATNATMTSSVSTATDLQRFYRIAKSVTPGLY